MGSYVIGLGAPIKYLKYKQGRVNVGASSTATTFELNNVYIQEIRIWTESLGGDYISVKIYSEGELCDSISLYHKYGRSGPRLSTGGSNTEYWGGGVIITSIYCGKTDAGYEILVMRFNPDWKVKNIRIDIANNYSSSIDVYYAVIYATEG